MAERAAIPNGRIRLEPARAGPVGRWAVILLLAALTLRTCTDENTQPRLVWYVALMACFLLLFFLTWWKQEQPDWLHHGYLAVQCGIVLAMLAVNLEVDGVTAFIGLLSFQAALFFAGPNLWLWVGGMSVVTAGSLVAGFGFLQGLGLAMSPIAFIIAIPVFMVVNQETEAARARSQAMLASLQETQLRLQGYAGQVEELASLQERGRLARGLHDTVSQLVFSITFSSRSAQLLLKRDPNRVREQLERMRETSTSALSQLRSLISQMRM